MIKRTACVLVTAATALLLPALPAVAAPATDGDTNCPVAPISLAAGILGQGGSVAMQCNGSSGAAGTTGTPSTSSTGGTTGTNGTTGGGGTSGGGSTTGAR
ncbi:hypothetical protein [Streptomyces sp. RPT161]|uniref:hypothetical protein n=1 Tax=Streptomyces sp. RPT161 TaxID=3015993 RepID=UPI0022B91CA0|nr:hypothetical protein [Streptomyces sp. RPT161]